MEERKNEKSEFYKWLNIFPENLLNHPAFITDQKFISQIKNISIYQKLQKDTKILNYIYENISNKYPIFSAKFPFSEFHKFYYILASRFFGICLFSAENKQIRQIPLIVPYADMANCEISQKANAFWEFDNSEKMFKFRAKREIKKNEEILINYGHRSNFSYFTHYGFTLENENFDCATFIFDFNDKICPNAEFKKLILMQELSDYKIKKFYANCQNVSEFMQFCRFYWSDLDSKNLCQVFFLVFLK